MAEVMNNISTSASTKYIFCGKSLCELQNLLRLRGVTFSNTKIKADLVELCTASAGLNIEIDPDGLIEDRSDVSDEKLKMEHCILKSPQLIEDSNDISLALSISIFDIYKYLISFDLYDHARLRNYYKLEGYTMQQDGYVLDVTCVDYRNGYYALMSKVKPRTCDKYPVTKLPFYAAWIIIKNDRGNTSCIQSAYCSCRGGNDIPRLCNDQSLLASFNLPDKDEFLLKVKTIYPKACILDTKFVRHAHSFTTPALGVKTP